MLSFSAFVLAQQVSGKYSDTTSFKMKTLENTENSCPSNALPKFQAILGLKTNYSQGVLLK